MKIPTNKNIIRLAISCIILIMIFIFGYNQIGKIKQERGTIIANKLAIQANEFKINGLEKIKQNQAEFSKTVTVINGYLPDSSASSEFIIQMENLAKSHGIVIDSLSMGESSSKSDTGNISKIDFSAMAKSDYGKMIDYLKALENLARYNNIVSISITPIEQSGRVNIKFNGFIYQYDK